MLELSWKQFSQLPKMKGLNENQVKMEYNLYLENLSSQIQIKGQSTTDQNKPIQPYSGYLLQENRFYLLQEDGSKIFL